MLVGSLGILFILINIWGGCISKKIILIRTFILWWRPSMNFYWKSLRTTTNKFLDHIFRQSGIIYLQLMITTKHTRIHVTESLSCIVPQWGLQSRTILHSNENNMILWALGRIMSIKLTNYIATLLAYSVTVCIERYIWKIQEILQRIGFTHYVIWSDEISSRIENGCLVGGNKVIAASRFCRHCMQEAMPIWKKNLFTKTIVLVYTKQICFSVPHFSQPRRKRN